MKDLQYLVVGGDGRQGYLTTCLIEEKKRVSVIFGGGFKHIVGDDVEKTDWKNAIRSSDVIIFPLPISKDDENLNADYKIKLAEIVNEIPSNKVVMAGGVTPKIKSLFELKNIEVIDYFNREELTVCNAIPTAEGAIEIAMRELPITINNSKCLITGFGRISKILVKVLHGLGAKTTVVARKNADLVWASIYGASVQHIADIKLAVKGKDVIFNTVPFKIINEDALSNVDKSCLIIDVASKPGGVDFEVADRLGINVIWALALPGKVAPKTAGEAIKTAINNILKEADIVSKKKL